MYPEKFENVLLVLHKFNENRLDDESNPDEWQQFYNKAHREKDFVVDLITIADYIYTNERIQFFQYLPDDSYDLLKIFIESLDRNTLSSLSEDDFDECKEVFKSFRIRFDSDKGRCWKDVLSKHE